MLNGCRHKAYPQRLRPTKWLMEGFPATSVVPIDRLELILSECLIRLRWRRLRFVPRTRQIHLRCCACTHQAVRTAVVVVVVELRLLMAVDTVVGQAVVLPVVPFLLCLLTVALVAVRLLLRSAVVDPLHMAVAPGTGVCIPALLRRVAPGETPCCRRLT